MEIENLRRFVQMVDSGSVQGAARQLGLSRSVLRRCLDELEAEIGTPLVHRDPTGVRLTAAGAVTLERARPMLDSAAVLLADARAADREARGILRVIEPVGLPLALQATAILAAHVAMHHQRLVVRHVEDPLANLAHPFEIMLHEGPAPDRNAWFSRVLLRVKLSLLASRGYLELRGVPRSLPELAGHEALGWDRPGHPAGEWPLLAGGSVSVTPWFASSDPQLLTTLAQRGGGLLLAPGPIFTEHTEAEPLQPVLEDQVGAELVFRITTPCTARAYPRTRGTLGLIIAQLEGLPVD